MSSVKYICRGLAAMLFTLSMASGCIRDALVLEQEFEQTGGIHLTVRGNVVMEYDPLSCQIGYNPSSCEYKVCDDNMSDYFMLRCSRIPSEVGETVNGNVTWTTWSDVKTRRNLSFEVVRTEPADGMVWLWAASARIGITVRII